MAGLAMVNGVLCPDSEARIPATDPGFLLGWTVFETLAVRGGAAWRRDEHLARLAASAETGLVPMPRGLADEIDALAAAFGGEGRMRVTLTRGGNRVLVVSPVDPLRRFGPVRAARGRHRDEPYLGGRLKHGSRMAWAVAVERSGVDDLLLVDDDGRFTEATTAAIVAVVGGVLWTPPDDGRILSSTTIAELEERAHALGIAVRREAPSASGGWDGLYLASSTRDLCPVVELDGEVQPGWEPVGKALVAGVGGPVA